MDDGLEMLRLHEAEEKAERHWEAMNNCADAGEGDGDGGGIYCGLPSSY